MNTIIGDPAVPRAASPRDPASYVPGHGWREVERIGDKGTAWICAPRRGKGYEILVPCAPTSGTIFTGSPKRLPH